MNKFFIKTILMFSFCALSAYADGNNSAGSVNPPNGAMIMPPPPPSNSNCNAQPASNGPDIAPGTYAMPSGGTIYTTGTNKHPDFSPVDCNGDQAQIYPQIITNGPPNGGGGFNGGGMLRR